MYFDHGKNLIRRLPKNASELIDLSSLPLDDRYRVDHWFAKEKFELAFHENLDEFNEEKNQLFEIALEGKKEKEVSEGRDGSNIELTEEEKNEIELEYANRVYSDILKSNNIKEEDVAMTPEEEELGDDYKNETDDKSFSNNKEYGRDVGRHERFQKFVENVERGLFKGRKNDYNSIIDPSKSKSTTTQSNKETITTHSELTTKQSGNKKNDNIKLDNETEDEKKEQISTIGTPALPIGYTEVSKFHHKYYCAREPFCIRFEITRMFYAIISYIMMPFDCREFTNFVVEFMHKMSEFTTN
jgi:hypothetical protein